MVGYSSLRLHDRVNISTDVKLDFLLFNFPCPSKAVLYLFMIFCIVRSFDRGILVLFSTGFDSRVVGGGGDCVAFLWRLFRKT